MTTTVSQKGVRFNSKHSQAEYNKDSPTLFTQVSEKRPIKTKNNHTTLHERKLLYNTKIPKFEDLDKLSTTNILNELELLIIYTKRNILTHFQQIYKDVRTLRINNTNLDTLLTNNSENIFSERRTIITEKINKQISNIQNKILDNVIYKNIYNDFNKQINILLQNITYIINIINKSCKQISKINCHILNNNLQILI